jgi:hypothetical protein
LSHRHSFASRKFSAAIVPANCGRG